MTTRTETVETVYGDVEVSLVDCDSCGNPVRKRDAVEFSIGGRDGWACEHCEEEGPLSFPERVGLEEPPFLWLIFAVFAPLVFILCIGFMADPDTDTEDVHPFLGLFIGSVVYTAGTLILVSGMFGNLLSLLPF